MMKKQSILSWLLAFCLCFAMAMPVLAATSVSEIEAEHDVAVVNEDNVSFDFSELDAFVKEAEREFAKESLEKAANVQVYSLENTVSDEELPLVFNMAVVGEDYSMTYYKEDGQDAVVYVSESKPVENQDAILTQEEFTEDEIMPMSLSGCNGPCSKTTNLPDGYGVRLPINNTSGQVLTFTVFTSGNSDTKLPTNAQGTTLSGNCYLYGGFSANTASINYEADLGLVYQKLKDSTEVGWKPYFLFKKGSTELAYTYPDSNYSDVQGKNAYVPGDANGIGVEIYPNYNGSHYIRLRTEGKTMHTNQYGGSEQKWLINIIQTKNTYVLNNINKYKLLATSSVSSPYSESDISKTYCSGKFTKIAIGGSTPTFGSLETDYGYGTKNSSNSYTLGVCKGK